MTNYQRTYRLLKMAGHSPFTAASIIIDAMRSDRYAMDWIRIIFNARH